MVESVEGLDTSLNDTVGSTLLDACSSTVRICAQRAAAVHRRLTGLMLLHLADHSSCPAQALSGGLALLDRRMERIAPLVTEDGAGLAGSRVACNNDDDEGHGGNEVGDLHLGDVDVVVVQVIIGRQVEVELSELRIGLESEVENESSKGGRRDIYAFVKAQAHANKSRAFVGCDIALRIASRGEGRSELERSAVGTVVPTSLSHCVQTEKCRKQGKIGQRFERTCAGSCKC